MSDTTAHLALPFIMAAQAQKHVTMNEALRIYLARDWHRIGHRIE